MSDRRYIRALVSSGYLLAVNLLLILSVRSLLVMGVSRALSFTLFACVLLLGLVEYSAAIRRIAASLAQTLRDSFLPPLLQQRTHSRPQALVVLPNRPPIASLFQRPPPVSFL
jgi:hypothetical protein